MFSLGKEKKKKKKIAKVPWCETHIFIRRLQEAQIGMEQLEQVKKLYHLIEKMLEKVCTREITCGLKEQAKIIDPVHGHVVVFITYNSELNVVVF